MTTCHFRAQNSPFAQNENFFRKTINICSMYLSAPFIVQNFKKILRIDPKLWGRTIFRVKMARLLQKIFFSDNPCCVQSCLSACKKKKNRIRCQSINEILTIKEYWKCWLAKSIFGRNLRTKFFPNMRSWQNAKRS